MLAFITLACFASAGAVISVISAARTARNLAPVPVGSQARGAPGRR